MIVYELFSVFADSLGHLKEPSGWKRDAVFTCKKYGFFEC